MIHVSAMTEVTIVVGFVVIVIVVLFMDLFIPPKTKDETTPPKDQL